MTVRSLRQRLGAKNSVVLLLLAPALSGCVVFGPRAAWVLVATVALCTGASVLTRHLAGLPWRLYNPGTVITGLLLGLTLSADVPLYMVVVGALVAELPGKHRIGWLGRNPLNPAALGRAAVAVLELLDPPLSVDVLTAASPLFKDAGGNVYPEWGPLLLGLTDGAIGETSTLVLAVVGVPLLWRVVLKRTAALALLVTVPLLVAVAPSTPEIVGHAPWAVNPVIYLLGSATLLNALFFATDPSTTPETRAGGIAFGVGAAALGVYGRLYTTLPGAEMWGILVMNLATPGLDALARRWAGRERRRRTSGAPVGGPSFYWGGADEATPLPVHGGPIDPLRVPGLHPAGTDLDGLGELLVALDPQAVLEELDRAGLTGCGGGHYPVAHKWRAALGHPGPRILVVNGQEGEPGSAKDRLLLTAHTARVVKGTAIAARVLGAAEVFVVLPPDLPEAVAALARDLARLRRSWPDCPPVQVITGPGLYVCGEESALLQFLAGERGEPQPRPPYPTERGLRGQPTVVQNVETLSWLPEILHGGGERFAQGGRPKLVTVSGAVARPGVYAVRLGTPLVQVLGFAGAHSSPAAVAVGGPGGGYLPPSLLHLPLAPQALAEAGAVLGSGAIEVLGPDACLVAEVLKDQRFFAQTSCGRCTPCRVGTTRIADQWASLLAGSEVWDRAALERTAGLLEQASTCGLGRSSAHRLRSVLRHWPDHVQLHQQEGSCQLCRASA